MSVTRSTLSGGPAYAAFNSQNIQFLADSKLEYLLTSDVLSSALRGDIDEIDTDFMLKGTGTPMFYDTAALATMFPYIGGIAPGTVFPGSTDKTCVWTSVNGDEFTLTSALIGKMPDLSLGPAGALLGPLEIWGIIGNGDDPATANSYYTEGSGSYSAPAVPSTAVVGRQEFTAAWGSITGFTSFQAQDKWTIQHELKLEPWKGQGRTRAFKFLSYRCMAKCRPLGPTLAQLDANCYYQGSGAGGGYKRSSNAANLVITGSNSITVTLGNAFLKTKGMDFAGQPLRQGEIAFVTSIPGGDTNSGSTTAPLQLA